MDSFYKNGGRSFMKKTVLFLLFSSLIYAENPFESGNKNFGLTVGTDNSFGNNYTVVGANVNYYVIDNLSIGASYNAFIGDSPNINEVNVPVTYHIPIEGVSYRPYIGAFYNQTFIDDHFNDYNIFGGRIGVSLQTSINSFMSLGWVQEFSTSDNNQKKKGYPQISAGFSF